MLGVRGRSPMDKVMEIAKCGKFNKEWLSLVAVHGLEQRWDGKGG